MAELGDVAIRIATAFRVAACLLMVRHARWRRTLGGDAPR
jgi:hypothetical protein